MLVFLGPQRTPGLTTNVLDMDDCHRKCHWRMEIRRITHRNHECPVGGFQTILATPCRCLLWLQVSNGQNFRWLMIRIAGLGCFFPWKSWTNLMWETTLHQPVGLGMTGSPSYPHHTPICWSKRPRMIQLNHKKHHCWLVNIGVIGPNLVRFVGNYIMG